MITFLGLKQLVSNILGTNVIQDPILDNFINLVRREDIANAYHFSWLKRNIILTTNSQGIVVLPENYNATHKPDHIRVLNGQEIFLTDMSVFLADTNSSICYISVNDLIGRFELNTRLPNTQILFVYFMVPSNLVLDTDIDVIPDSAAVVELAAAKYWLSSERDVANFDRFIRQGIGSLNRMITRDKNAHSIRKKAGSIYTQNLGFNVRNNTGGF